MRFNLPFIAAYHTGCYLLLHAVHFCTRLLPHAMKFATGCRMVYNLLFVATCRTVLLQIQHNLGEIGHSKLLNNRQY